MKKIRVGTWYNKLTPAQKEYFSIYQPKWGTNKLRSFFTAASKFFPNSIKVYGKNLSVAICENGQVRNFLFHGERKEFVEILID